MSSLTTTLANFCNLRTVVVICTFSLILGAAPPLWFSDFVNSFDRSVFRFGLSTTAMAPPRTRITVVHVPVTDYQGWIADPLGAVGLQRVLAVLTDPRLQPKPRVGLILEQSLRFDASATETALSEIQAGRKLSDHLYQETKELLDRRELLFKQLRSEQVSLGLLDSVPALASSNGLRSTQVTRLPDWLASSFNSDLVENKLDARAELPYLPIILSRAVAQNRVFHSVDGHSFPTFWSLLPGTNPRDTAVVPLGIDTSFVPVYGSMSGIHSSIRQITLDAALTSNSFGEWVLIGKDGDARLEEVAQILASVCDHAILLEPWWWTLALKYQLLLSVLVMTFVVPLLSVWVGIGILVFALVVGMLVQVWGQSLASLWLPCGLMFCYNVVSFAILALWRWQRSVSDAIVARADQASLVVARGLTTKGDLDRAFQFANSCRSSSKVLDQIYQIGVRYEERGELEKAQNALRELKRRKRKYKDVAFRLEQIKSKLRPEAVHSTSAILEASPNEPVLSNTD